jgi:predicted metal-dependent hydrolase
MRRKWGSVSCQGNLTLAEDVRLLPEALYDNLA